MQQVEMWYSCNLLLLCKNWPQCRIEYDREECKWIRLVNFPLPPNFAQRKTDLLLLLPGIHHPITGNMDDFYLDQNLKSRNGGTPDHVFERGSGHCRPELAQKGYAWFCLHLQRWQPSFNVLAGDNLLNVVNTVYNQLATL